VTTVAGQAGLNMSGRFASRLHTIVTGGAGTGSYSGMGKGYCGPHRRPMACVARLRRWNMRCRFPPCATDGIVMACGTGTGSDPIMGEIRRYPVGRAVATLAIHRGRKMIRGLERGKHPPSGRMTLEALRWRSSEYPLSMAPFARDLGMAARQLESGRAVIKFHIRPIRALSDHLFDPANPHQQSHTGRQDTGQHKSGNPSTET